MCRMLAICLLTPVVVLFCVSALVGFAVLGALGAAQAKSVAARWEAGEVGATIPVYARDRVATADGVGARRSR